MHPLVAVLIIAIMGGIIYLSRSSETPEEARKKFLKKLGLFLEAEPAFPEENGGAVAVIQFVSGGRDFLYEDVEDRTLEKDIYRQAFLKTQTRSKLSLTFSEKNRSTIRADISNIENLKSGWAQASGIILPPLLSEFSLFSNHYHMAQELMRDPRVEKIFARYKNRGDRGHPIMSLEVKAGQIRLKFHPPGDLIPNIYSLQQDFSSIGGYLDEIIALADILEALQDKYDAQDSAA